MYYFHLCPFRISLVGLFIFLTRIHFAFLHLMFSSLFWLSFCNFCCSFHIFFSVFTISTVLPVYLIFLWQWLQIMNSIIASNPLMITPLKMMHNSCEKTKSCRTSFSLVVYLQDLSYTHIQAIFSSIRNILNKSHAVVYDKLWN